jgi:hypothetical protein
MWLLTVTPFRGAFIAAAACLSLTPTLAHGLADPIETGKEVIDTKVEAIGDCSTTIDLPSSPINPRKICCNTYASKAEAGCRGIPSRVMNDCLRRFPPQCHNFALMSFCQWWTSDITDTLVSYCTARARETLEAKGCGDYLPPYFEDAPSVAGGEQDSRVLGDEAAFQTFAGEFMATQCVIPYSLSTLVSAGE